MMSFCAGLIGIFHAYGESIFFLLKFQIVIYSCLILRIENALLRHFSFLFVDRLVV